MEIYLKQVQPENQDYILVVFRDGYVNIKPNKCHKTCKSHNNKGDHIMTNGRKTTYEERIEIVAFCIANANDYNLTANKYKVSYQQVYTQINKYNRGGYEALVDRRGKRKKLEDLSESEKIAAQLKLLESENRHLKMENDFLKKLTSLDIRYLNYANVQGLVDLHIING